jgi:hypothetical protein
MDTAHITMRHSMLTHHEVLKEIYDALIRENEMRAPTDQIPLSPGTPLFGDKGILSSFELVTLLLEVEDIISSRVGSQITLSDERAMAARRNPFRSPASLADYVMGLIGGGPAP